MQLYNKLSKKERLELINKAGERRLTLSFYKYHQIKNTTIFRNYLFIEWDKLDVLGRIYIAHEGINAQLSVPSNRMIEFKSSIDTISFLLASEVAHHDFINCLLDIVFTRLHRHHDVGLKPFHFLALAEYNDGWKNDNLVLLL